MNYIVARMFRSWIEEENGDVLRGNQFGFKREIGTRNAIGLLKTKSEQSLDMDKELCACFRD